MVQMSSRWLSLESKLRSCPHFPLRLQVWTSFFLRLLFLKGWMGRMTPIDWGCLSINEIFRVKCQAYNWYSITHRFYYQCSVLFSKGILRPLCILKNIECYERKSYSFLVAVQTFKGTFVLEKVLEIWSPL